MKQLKYQLTSVMVWLAENSQRVRMFVFVVTAAATVVALIAGLHSQGLLVAGPATGGGGGPEAMGMGRF